MLLRSLRLVLPALLPSWDFFEAVGPSPRIRFRLIRPEGTSDWCEHRPRPATVSVGTMLRRLFWNRAWNETLFLVSCAERMVTAPSSHSIAEIARRVAADLPAEHPATCLQIRLVFIFRDGDRLCESVDYESTPMALAEFA